MKFTLVSSTLVLGLLQSSAIDIANFSAETNNRFANDPSFVGAGFDFSGVGRTSNGRWGTLLGDNYFVTANHFEPAIGQSLNFVAGNSSSSPTFSYSIAGRFPIAGTDLVISYFNEAVDSSIARYGFNTNNANMVSDLGLGDSELFLLGDRVPNAAGTVFDIVVGTNQAESFFEENTTVVLAPGPVANTFATPADFDQVVSFANASTDDAFTAFEAQLESGDSGSPLFSVVNGELRVEGLAFAVVEDPGFAGNFEDSFGPAGGPTDPLEEREGTLFTYLGSYTDELNGAIALVPSPIPEPSSFLLAATAAGFSFARRRRAVL